jgi:hypothetical protein
VQLRVPVLYRPWLRSLAVSALNTYNPFQPEGVTIDGSSSYTCPSHSGDRKWTLHKLVYLRHFSRHLTDEINLIFKEWNQGVIPKIFWWNWRTLCRLYLHRFFVELFWVKFDSMELNHLPNQARIQDGLNRMLLTESRMFPALTRGYRKNCCLLDVVWFIWPFRQELASKCSMFGGGDHDTLPLFG